jgi:hypothetical protein
MELHPDSHIDHIGGPGPLLDYVLHRFRDKSAFFIETVDLPDDLPALDCGLYGPLMGDGPVPESLVEYAPRGERPYTSRLVGLPHRKTRKLTVMGGWYAGKPCVLYTAFGGPPTPREPRDPSCPPEELDASLNFWGEHALAK